MKFNILNSLALTLLAIALFSISSCNKTSDTTPINTAQPGAVTIKFDHVWAMMESPFSLNTTLVHPMSFDTLTFTKFRYYVSNFKLKSSDGTWWSEPNSYHIIDLEASTQINLSDIPAGNYTEMEYVMGIDSARNVSGAQDGVLSVTEGMFWNWNSGYIMLKAEGTAPNAASNLFQFHLGGFTGANNIVMTKNTNFNGGVLAIASDKSPRITLKANPAKLWHSSPSVSVKNIIHMPGAEAKTMADNFYAGISFKELLP